MFYTNWQWKRPHVRIPLLVDMLVWVSPATLTAYNTEEDSNDSNSNPLPSFSGNFCLFFIILLVVDLLPCAHSYAVQYQIVNIFGTDAPKCKGLSALLREHGPEKPNASSQ
ncbi:hypothetical protein T09_11301 [Trichinella sp. T9]|nr:hypothetical protein T09_11301 [Trichinella sp. T9]